MGGTHEGPSKCWGAMSRCVDGHANAMCVSVVNLSILCVGGGGHKGVALGVGCGNVLSWLLLCVVICYSVVDGLGSGAVFNFCLSTS